MTSRQIRLQFLDFFASKGHVYVPSSPVAPHDDPTLMFTNAGMNQFKPIFLGSGRADHPRVANSQKCIRAGGKHNDLDDVGQDTYHHTFFEMLGNWSFGDYFKKEAIEWAWELLTKVWGIDKSRLHATYFRGDSAEGLEPDSEAAELWRTVTDIDPTHIHPGNKKDNFWEMGDTGPCGPCSEIHIDLTPDKSGRELVNKGDARVMELWNLVFIQFNRGSDGKLTPLPAKHVDTGMGFERLCAILQKKTSNYDTDVFTPIFEAIRKRTGAPSYQGTLPDQNRDSHGAVVDSDEATKRRSDGANRHGGTEARRSEGKQATIDPPQAEQSAILVDVSYRVIADHLRCLVFALTDGAIPSNEGRGYVLRRILRRAVRYGRQYLNMHEPFLCDLVPTIVEHMETVFPELRNAHGGKNVQHVTALIREEESSFIKTLDRGIKLFEEAAEYARRNHHGKISGEDSFKLHDTYGFPIDLTELMAEEQGLTIDVGEYERLMEGARDRARAGVDMMDAVAAAQTRQAIDDALMHDRPKDDFKYDAALRCKSRIMGGAWQTRPGDEAATVGQQVILSLSQTPFYAEQGGQVCDVGDIVTQNGTVRVARVERHDHPGGYIILHTGKVVSGQIIGKGEECEAIVSSEHRIPTTKNHTSTHILNWALREVLGEHVQQKGSLVDPEKTRFDFSHPKQLSEDELTRIEHHVKSQISNAIPVFTKPEADQKKAREINTLRAVFGEKYLDKVRVVSVGADIEAMLRDPKNPKWMQYSVEFCGGTHLKNSNEAEEFVLVHEEAVAKGVRRLLGLTADKAREAIRRGEEFLEIAEALRTGHTPPLPPLIKGGGQGPSPQPSPLKGEGAVGPQSGPYDLRTGGQAASGTPVYDLARLLRELSEATIPMLIRHQLAEQIAVLQESAKEHEKKATAKAQRGAVEAVADLLASQAVDVAGVTVLVAEVPQGNADALRSGIDYVRNKKSSSAVLLATVDDGKVTLVAGMSKDLVERGIKAGDLIKEICPLVGGKGGGRPDMAQGGGTDPKGLPQALERATEWIAGKLAC